MMTNTIITNSPIHYSLTMLEEEVRHLLDIGAVSRNQPLYVLCQHIPAREWVQVERELERCDYLLRDRIGDLVAKEIWQND